MPQFKLNGKDNRKRGIGSRGANFANHMPYLSKAKQRDLMCEEDAWKVKDRSDFGSFTSNRVKNLGGKASQTKHYKCGSWLTQMHAYSTIHPHPPKNPTDTMCKQNSAMDGERKRLGEKQTLKKKDQFRSQVILGLSKSCQKVKLS